MNLFTEENLDKWRQDCPSIQSIEIPDRGFLYRQGHSCSYVFLICQGIVKLSFLTEQGNELTISLIKGGDIIGCVQDNSSNNRTMVETAQSLGGVTVFRLDYPEFKALISNQTALSWQVFEMQWIRRQQAERKLLNILAQPVENRVIAMLIELADLFGKRCAHGYALEIQLTQQELADLVGASRSVVSTIMNDFRSRRMLDYTRELICINDVLLAESCKQK